MVVTPNLLLWVPKVAYRGSLTATFVNKNTAAAFFGCGAISLVVLDIFCRAIDREVFASGIAAQLAHERVAMSLPPPP